MLREELFRFSAEDKDSIWKYFDSKSAYCSKPLDASSREGYMNHLVQFALSIHDFVLACYACKGNEKRETPWKDFLKIKCNEQEFKNREEQIKKWINAPNQARLANAQLIERSIETIHQKLIQTIDKAFEEVREFKNNN